MIPLETNILDEQLSEQTSNSVTTHNNNNLTKQMKKIPTTQHGSGSNTGNKLNRKLVFPVRNTSFTERLKMLLFFNTCILILNRLKFNIYLT